MNWLPFRHDLHSEQALLAFWDEVLTRQPSRPIPPADAPADLTSIVRALQSANTELPTVAYQDDLLATLLTTYDKHDQKETPTMTSSTATAPLSPPIRPPRSARPTLVWPESARRWNLSAALGITLVVLLILASVAGIWLVNDRNNDSHILAPPVATPTTEASPDVPMYRGNAARTGEMAGPGPLGSPVELWMTEIGSSINSAPAIVDGILYFGAGNGGVYALDIANGTEVWRVAGDSTITSSPAVANGIVYVGNDSGILYALHVSDGSEVWTFPGTRSNASVAVDNGTVYTGSVDGFLYAIDAATGEENWRAPLNESASRSPAIAEGLVYIGSTDGVLHAIDAATGAETWAFQTEGGGLLATTAIGQEALIQTTFDGDQSFVYGLDLATGEELWRYEQAGNPGFLSPAIGNGFVFIPSLDARLHVLDAMTGEEVWTFQTGAMLNAAPALVGDTIYLAGNDGFVYSLDAATGAELWRFTVEGEVDMGPVVSAGVIYVGTGFGYFYGIGGSNSLPAMADATEDTIILPPASPAATVASPVATNLSASLAWEVTGGDNSLSQPTDVTIAPDGNIWVADGGNSQFQIFTPDGTFVEAWGTPGNGDGELNFLRANSEGDTFGSVAFAPDGSFYVTDVGNLRVQHFSADRQFLDAWGSFGSSDGEFLSPIDVGVDSHGNIFVSDDKRKDVQKFSADGTFLLTFGGFGSDPGQMDPGFIEIDAQDTVWVADTSNHRIQAFDGNGQFIAAYDATGPDVEPIDVAIDDQGRIFVTTFVLDPSGTSVIAELGEPGTGAGQFTAAWGVAVDSTGGVYVSDYLGNKLVKFQLQESPAYPAATPVG